MPSFGEKLRSEREARGIRLSTVAESTKISKGNLRALESNRFDELPGRVFNRGFVRAYAEFIGVDPDAMVAAYESEERAQERRRQDDLAAPGAAAAPGRVDPGASTPTKVRFSRRLAVAAVLTLVGAVALTAWLMRPGAPPPAATSPAPAPSLPPTSERPVETESAAAQAPEGEALRSAPDEPPAAASPVPAPSLPPAPERPVEPEPAAEATPEGEAHRQVPDEPAASPPPDEPESESTPGQPDSPSAPPTLSIPESGVGARVVDRRLEGRGTTFEVGDRVWFWTRVLGGQPGERIQHVWLREGTPVSSVEIVLGGSHWRAYTWKTMYPGSAGRWAAEARDADGRILTTEAFTCVRP
jgi:cytoskeleton protein RodZ